MDSHLLKKCSNGDRRAQFDLYKQCYPVLMSICRRYRKNDDEVSAMLNAGFLKVLSKLKSYKNNVPFEAWIKRIMINTLIDDYRMNKKEKEHVFYEETPKLVVLGKAIDYNEADKQFDASHIKSIIHRLPPVDKQVFNLYAIDGYSHKEIATQLKFTEGTSKWYLSKARKQIKAMLVAEMKKEEQMRNRSKV